MDDGYAALVLAVAVAISPSKAKAEDRPPPVELLWTAPTGCPTQERIRVEVEELLGRSLESPSNAALSAHATVTHEKGRYRLLLSVARGTEHRDRVIADTNCDRIGRAAALVVELAIDDTTNARASDGEPERGTSAALPVAEAPSLENAVPSTPPAPARDRPPLPVRTGPPLHFSVRAGGGVEALALPHPAPGATFALALRHTFVDVEGFLSYWAPEQATTPTGAGGDVWLAVGGVRGCLSPLHQRLELGACASVELGSMRAKGVDVDHPGSGDALWVAPAAGLRGALRLAGPVAAVANVDAAVPLVRRTFVLGNVGDVYRPPSATVRVAIGVESRAPVTEWRGAGHS